jgi:hypothetical protein
MGPRFLSVAGAERRASRSGSVTDISGRDRSRDLGPPGAAAQPDCGGRSPPATGQPEPFPGQATPQVERRSGVQRRTSAQRARPESGGFQKRLRRSDARGPGSPSPALTLRCSRSGREGGLGAGACGWGRRWQAGAS